MNLIPVSSVIVRPKRQRKVFDEAKIAELRASIESDVGLLHPIVLRGEADGLVLVAGERRLRAIQDIYELGGSIRHGGKAIPAGQVPYVDLGEVSALIAWDAELTENIQREDLTWQERAAATAELIELRTLQAEEAGKPAPSRADIAREVFGDKLADKSAGELGAYSTTVGHQAIVSKFLDDPEVAAAPSLKEAVKVLKKREEQRRNTELAVSVGATYNTSFLTCRNEDSLEWMRGASADQFQIILTDPPYGMNAHEFNDSGSASAGSASAGSHFYDDSYEEWQRIMSVFCPESFRLAAPAAHAYVFCDIDRFEELRGRMSGAGWKVHRTPLIWHNPEGFRVPWPDAGPQRKYELILYAVKGDRRVATVKGDVLTYSRDKALGHPAQKPVPLLIDLLARSARPGDCVFDPFAGSGSVLEAAFDQKLRCVAFERDANAFGIAVKRIKSFEAFEPALF